MEDEGYKRLEAEKWLKENNIRIQDNSLNLTNLKEPLKHIPSSIGYLPLKELYIDQKELKDLPKTIGQLKELVTLVIDNTAIKCLPDSIGNLKNLESKRKNPVITMKKSITTITEYEFKSFEQTFNDIQNKNFNFITDFNIFYDFVKKIFYSDNKELLDKIIEYIQIRGKFDKNSKKYDIILSNDMKLKNNMVELHETLTFLSSFNPTNR